MIEYQRYLLIIRGILFSLLVSNLAVGQNPWDPRAGIDQSQYYKFTGYEASSFPYNNVFNIQDNNDHSCWMSDAPLPVNYLKRIDQNFLYARGNEWCRSSGGTNFARITDGNLQELTHVNTKGGRAWLHFHFPTFQELKLMHVKARTSSWIDIYAFSSPTDSTLIGHYLDYENYEWKSFDFKDHSWIKLGFYSNQAFDVFEIGSLAENPKEFVIVDLGTPKEVGFISSRHWPGESVVESSSLYVSSDKYNWVKVDTLDPLAVHNITTVVEPPIEARYIKLEHTLKLKDYASCFVWELDATGGNGRYGPMPEAKQSEVTVKEMLGVNTIMGWGHDKYTDLLQKGEGPYLHNDYASHARFYHNMNWDVSDPDNSVDFEAMAKGAGTETKWWLNWDRELDANKKAGLDLHVTLKIENFPHTAWDSPFHSAFDYGYKYAQHFGSTYGNGLVQSIEIGNEPWSYQSNYYREILRGMASGIKAGDPTMEVLPCALQASNPSADNSLLFKHFIGTKITPAEAQYLDGLTIHAYSFTYNKNGERIGTYPENETSSFRELLNMIRFRDYNLPYKPIFLTEWGWDSDGVGEDCLHSECVSEMAATAYATRGLMMAMRLGIKRASWYFYGNYGSSELWSRSGLTGSEYSRFSKKRTFKAFETLLNLVGDAYFHSVIKEDKSAWVYLLVDSTAKPTHLIAWRPIEGDSEEKVSISFDAPRPALRALKIDGATTDGLPVTAPAFENGKMTMDVSAMPVIVELAYPTSTKGTILASRKVNESNTEEYLINKKRKLQNVSNQNTIDLDNWKLYPNPTTGSLFLSGLPDGEISNIQIIDPLGRERYKSRISSTFSEINLRELALESGMYVLNTTYSNGQVNSRPFFYQESEN